MIDLLILFFFFGLLFITTLPPVSLNRFLPFEYRPFIYYKEKKKKVYEPVLIIKWRLR